MNFAVFSGNSQLIVMKFYKYYTVKNKKFQNTQQTCVKCFDTPHFETNFEMVYNLVDLACIEKKIASSQTFITCSFDILIKTSQNREVAT